jgi:hypothetical protein
LTACLSALFLGQAVYGASGDSVDKHRFEMDSQVRDIMWCGNTNEAILLLSEKGTIYRSRDRGSSWRKLGNILKKTGESVADEGQ